jgi:hypothetical protein
MADEDPFDIPGYVRAREVYTVERKGTVKKRLSEEMDCIEDL